jgi:alpha-L-fucosidase
MVAIDQKHKSEIRTAFLDLHFGMFIHFGLYSQGKLHEWHMFRKLQSLKSYKSQFLGSFDPDPAGMEQWVKTAKAMGAKYLVCTSKHHDGFCLWDSKVPHLFDPEYHIRNTPFYQKHKRGVLDYLFDAGKKHGIKIGLYYSAVDWSWEKKPLFRFPLFFPKTEARLNEYNTYYQAQLVELGKKYSELLCFWFDGYHFRPGFSEKLRQNDTYELLSTNFPNTLIVSNTGRVDKVTSSGKTDLLLFETADHSGQLSPAPWPRSDPEQLPGEVCLTLNRHWGYNAVDKDYKSPEGIANLVKANIERKSNTLLNFGPQPNGFIADEQVAIAEEIGRKLQ